MPTIATPQDVGTLSKKIIANVAGETGIDIMPIGAGKSQILADFDMDHDIYFFGDRCEPGGNDYDIAEAVKMWPKGHVFHVKNWQDTFNCLQNVINGV